jgi:hypothetical protein
LPEEAIPNRSHDGRFEAALSGTGIAPRSRFANLQAELQCLSVQTFPAPAKTLAQGRPSKSSIRKPSDITFNVGEPTFLAATA